MRKLTINIKTGFKVPPSRRDQVIFIRDSRGVIFYDTEEIEKAVEYFNLPAGSYLVESGTFYETLFPRTYRLASLPPPERNRRAPYDFKIEFRSNPNKCSIIWDEKRIVFDSSFCERPLPELYFILFHEYGHALYKTEKYCDLYASNCMKVKGFNPSQIVRAHVQSLGGQEERKEFVTEKILENL